MYRYLYMYSAYVICVGSILLCSSVRGQPGDRRRRFPFSRVKCLRRTQMVGPSIKVNLHVKIWEEYLDQHVTSVL